MKKHFTQILGKDASIKLSLANAQISYAQAAAMADLFEDFKQMYNAPKHEIDTHLSIIKSEKSALITERKGKSKKKPLSEQSKTILKEIDMRFTKATAVRYLDLAKKNYSHFTHVHIGGGNNNIQEWQKLHGEAADVAQQAKKNKSANELSMAFARNSFADHYLMDAFAVGHLTARSTKEDEDDMRKHIASKLDDVITEVLIEKIGTKWYLFFLLITPGLAHLTALLAFLTGQGLAGREDIKSLPFKIVHDMDNKYGRRVANKKGDEWEAYGDKFLLSKENLESNYPRVVNAVKISKNELIHSASKNEKPGNKPIELYPSSFEKRNWNEEMAVKALKNLVSEKFSMLKLLWTTDNIVRRYIEKTTPEEMYKISPDGKVRMINELLPGWTGGADERAILKMMKYSQSRQVFNIMEQIGLSKLAANIHGKEYKQFISLLANKYSKLPVNLKIIFINKLLEGATLDVEENGILQLLRHSSSGEVYRIVNDVRFKELADNIHGAEYDKFIYILENKYRNVGLNGKKELINALLQVTTGDLEEWAINEIIRNAKSNDVATIINTIGFGDFDDNIHGGEYRTFLNVLVNKYKYLDVVQKIRLIKALCSGSTSEVEEETIISLLKDALTSSKEDFKTIVRKVGKSELYSELTGREENQFEEMLENTGMK
ncbi:MAG: hypothetical protein IBX40_12270 [Methanosarcinales archaeon]|nr:hypothetical protein [Methanosarcinales archaeon]